MTTTDAGTREATVWGLRNGVVLCCFRATVDRAGRIARTTLGEREDHTATADRDGELTARLRHRYGADLELRVIIDDGAGFTAFQQALADHIRPAPPPRPTPTAPN